MFSRLEPLFLNQFRQAESADTRQAIREEQKDQRRNQAEQEQEQENDQDLWTDNTVVSIESLRAFLVGFLKDQIDDDSGSIQAPDTPQIQSEHSATTAGQRAANAYQAMARQNERSYSPPPEHKETPATASQVESEDIRTINRLIMDLNILAERGQKELNIPKADTFLQSMEMAIKKALNT